MISSFPFLGRRQRRGRIYFVYPMVSPDLNYNSSGQGSQVLLFHTANDFYCDALKIPDWFQVATPSENDAS